jgi:hypothetical protein
MDLMQIMMSKIKRTEARCAAFEKESNEKDRRIRVLEAKLELYKNSSSRSSNGADTSELVQRLERRNLALNGQILEMENFLADYGLYWVGNKNALLNIKNYDDDDDDDDDTKLSDLEDEDNEIKLTRRLPFKCDYDLMAKNMAELNALVAESSSSGEARMVEFSPNRVKFAVACDLATIRLTLYANGICLLQGPFRPFAHSLTQKFCTDIMDGFFPTELQARYPDGVAFDLVDKRDILFIGNQTTGGKGYRLGSGRKVGSGGGGEEGGGEEGGGEEGGGEEGGGEEGEVVNRSETTSVETQLADSPPLTVGQFLSKLPAKVVRNSQLVDVRADIAVLLQNPASPQQEEEADRLASSPVLVNVPFNGEGQQEAEDKMAMLKIKWLTSSDSSSNKTFLFKMKYTDRLLDLKNLIKSQRYNSVNQSE